MRFKSQINSIACRNYIPLMLHICTQLFHFMCSSLKHPVSFCNEVTFWGRVEKFYWHLFYGCGTPGPPANLMLL